MISTYAWRECGYQSRTHDCKAFFWGPIRSHHALAVYHSLRSRNESIRRNHSSG